MKTYNFDFVIIGGGLAGLYSAHYASQFGSVALITKSTLDISNSYWAQGGIAAAIGKDDDPGLHFEDTITAGRGLCDNAAVKILVEEGRDRILELLKLGVPFDMTNDGPALGLEGGHSKRRILHAAGDSTGKEVVKYFTGIVEHNNKIKIFENTFVFELIVEDGKCSGLFAVNNIDNENFLFLSSNVIIAAGGASGIFSRTTNPNTSTGDGIALAYNAGAEIADMEFIQFHPTSFYSDTGDTFLISEAVRGEGAYLVNEDGFRFMQKLDPLAELAPRDVVASSIFKEIESSGNKCVYLKLDHLNAEKIKNRFSYIYNHALDYGVDITKNLIPVAPAAHYMIGGIKTDLNGETNVKGLFACGEVASTGVHGANRLASNSLLECIVFGKRTIDAARVNINNETTSDFRSKNIYIEKANETFYIAIKKNIAEIMMSKVGILRDEKSLREALDDIENIASKYNFTENEFYSKKLSDLIQVSKLIIISALTREESRGAHKRSDFPSENSSMKFHIIQRKDAQPEFLPLSN